MSRARTTADTPTLGATLAGTETLTNKTASSPIIIGPEERCRIVASAATGTINLDVLTAAVWFYTSNATANHTLNVRGNSTTTLNSLLSVGDSLSVAWLFTTGATGYLPSTFQIDGVTATVLWSGGSAPSAVASKTVAYTYTILKTAATPTYTVLAGASSYS